MKSAIVTNADFNGQTWDGGPFESDEPLDWLVSAVHHNRIRLINCDLDYAVWDVLTKAGTIRAMPGDQIICHDDDSLTVVEKPEKYRHPDRLPPLQGISA